MRILLVFHGTERDGKRHAAPLPNDLAYLPTSHQSECNYLLLSHWLCALGHQIELFVETMSPIATHFPQVSAAAVATQKYDAILLWKYHGARTAAKHNLLSLPWPRIAAWFDFWSPASVLGNDVERITHFVWGTDTIYQAMTPKYPQAHHTICEHATVFSAAPALSQAQPLGLYLGRLPRVYLREVCVAAEVVPVRALGLWVEGPTGEKIYLRPSQITEQGLSDARRVMPSTVQFDPPGNIIARATELSAAAFGLAPAVHNGPAQQPGSASKWWEYLALGLPVVTADNTPEAEHVRTTPELGYLYRQGDDRSLRTAVELALARALAPSFEMERKHLQEWVFTRGTYRERANTIHEFITR